jgi:hypothetical protein
MLSNRIDRAYLLEDRPEARRLKAVDFDVEVFRFNAQQAVSHRSADQHRPATSFAHSFTQSQDVRVHSGKDNPLGTGRKGDRIWL